jgi:glucose/mannose transport system substrate-binding protein
MKAGLAIFAQDGAVVPDQNIWRNEAFATAQNAIFSDLFFNPATTAEQGQAAFVDLLRNAD